jgi:uncharacterized integral membrane protein (TIGR00697 family)
MNELLFFALMLINFIGCLLFFKLWGKKGLFIFIGVISIATNIQVIKQVNLFGLAVTLGNSEYATTFLATDIINQKYGGKEARKSIWVSFLSQIFFISVMYMAVLFQANNFDIAQSSFETLFLPLPRLVLASLVTFIISDHLDTYIFQYFKKKFHNRPWLSSNGSTFISQFIDSVLFTVLAFYGFYETSILWEMAMFTYLVKVIVAFSNTPFLYLALKIKPIDEN